MKGLTRINRNDKHGTMLIRIVLFLVMGFFGGCSKRNWTAKIYIVLAENGIDRVHQLKARKVPYEERIKYYRGACHHFSKAYEEDRTVFTLNRIEIAADACWRAQELDKEEMFKAFELQYAKEHPQEYEYGDAGVNMIEMG